MRHYFKLFILSILVGTILVGKLQAAPDVGFVKGLNCMPKVYTLTRNGQNIPVKFNTPLQEGDQISINTDEIGISLKMISEQKISVEHQTLYTVVAPPFSVNFTEKPCSDDTYSIKRNDQMLPMQQPMVLVGDQIVVDKDKPWIKLEFADKVVKINQKNSPYTVNSTTPISMPKRVESIGAYVARLFKDNFSKSLDRLNLKNRGVVEDASSTIPAPYINLLKKSRERVLVAGTRPLYLAWRKGKAPYKLTIQQKGKNTQIFSKHFEEQRVKTPVLDLTVGNYYLQVCDARSKCSKKRSFIVVDKSERPKYPREFTDSSIPEAPRLTAQAFWLAAQEKSKWAFEAYQQLAPLADNEQQARIVRDALELGKRIKLPKK